MTEMIDRVLDIMLSRGLNATQDDARAAIEAMREPSGAMSNAGWRQISAATDPDAVYQAMINEALKE